jgi:hypothetical protein
MARCLDRGMDEGTVTTRFRSRSERPGPARMHPRRVERGNGYASAIGPRSPALSVLPETRAPVARRISQACAVSGVAVGLVVLCGWAFDVVALKSLASSMVSTKPNAALAFTLTGVALLLLERRGARAQRGGWCWRPWSARSVC